jgi:hypothetical protein
LQQQAEEQMEHLEEVDAVQMIALLPHPMELQATEIGVGMELEIILMLIPTLLVTEAQLVQWAEAEVVQERQEMMEGAAGVGMDQPSLLLELPTH